MAATDTGIAVSGFSFAGDGSSWQNRTQRIILKSDWNERGNDMGSLGMQEMIIILVIALIIFGPKKMPEIGKSLGKGIAEFKKASSDLAKTWQEEAQADIKPKESPVEKPETPVG
jgi:TatA/E family protein of Tat protein translocase